MPLSTIFHLYRGDQFYRWKNPENHQPVTSHWKTFIT